MDLFYLHYGYLKDVNPEYKLANFTDYTDCLGTVHMICQKPFYFMQKHDSANFHLDIIEFIHYFQQGNNDDQHVLNMIATYMSSAQPRTVCALSLDSGIYVFVNMPNMYLTLGIHQNEYIIHNSSYKPNTNEMTFDLRVFDMVHISKTGIINIGKF
jgi:hypothetical protein